jgi:hypothetical protein
VLAAVFTALSAAAWLTGCSGSSGVEPTASGDSGDGAASKASTRSSSGTSTGASSGSITDAGWRDAATTTTGSSVGSASDAGSGASSTVDAASASSSSFGGDSGKPGGHTGQSPEGTVVSVGDASFVVQEADGGEITVETTAASTYQYTQASTVGTAAVGNYVAGMGAVSGGQLVASDLAFVPVPPPRILPQIAPIETAPQGTIYFGQMTAVAGSVITITTDAGALAIDTASVQDVTLTTDSDFQAIQVGEQVEINGPQSDASTTVYEGHQINIGLTPAVVGQFD